MIGSLFRYRAREADPLLAFDHLIINDDFWKQYRESLLRALIPRLLNAFITGADTALRIRAKASPEPAQQPPLDSAAEAERINRLAETAMRRYVSPYLDKIEETTRQSIIDAVIGARQSGGGVEEVISKISTLFSTERAQTIAVTETTRMFGIGAQAIFRDQGYGGWEWQTVADPHVDPTCASLRGQQFDADTDFSPAHPRCRCWPAPLYDAPEKPSETQPPASEQTPEQQQDQSQQSQSPDDAVIQEILHDAGIRGGTLDPPNTRSVDSEFWDWVETSYHNMFDVGTISRVATLAGVPVTRDEIQAHLFDLHNR